jgi:hypothetical protein
MVDDWMPVAFKVAIAVGLGVLVWKFVPNTVYGAVSNVISNYLGQLP